MGWWSSGASGGIAGFLDEPSGTDRDEVWGDGPADVMDAAIIAIAEEFQREFQRKPYKSELERGLAFSLGGYDEVEPDE